MDSFLLKFRSTLLGTAKIDAATKNSKEVLLPKAVFRRKILNEPFCVAKFLSKRRVAGCGTASRGFKEFVKPYLHSLFFSIVQHLSYVNIRYFQFIFSHFQNIIIQHGKNYFYIIIFVFINKIYAGFYCRMPCLFFGIAENAC